MVDGKIGRWGAAKRVLMLSEFNGAVTVACVLVKSKDLATLSSLGVEVDCKIESIEG